MIKRLLPLFCVIAAAVVVGVELSHRAIVEGRTLLWDESLHALYGLQLTEDVRRGHVLAFLYDSYRKVMWPPVYAWYLGGVFAMGPVSTWLARMTSVWAFGACAVLMYLSGTAWRPIAGLVAAAVILCSAGMLAFATQVMAESLASVGLVICFWLYFETIRSDGPAKAVPYAGHMPARRAETTRAALLGVAVCATFLTKYNYGVTVALALAAAFVMDSDRRRGQLITAGVLAALLLVWFAYPPKIGRTLVWLLNKPFGPERFSLEGLLYFPRATVWLAGSWPLLTTWLFAVALSCRPRILRADPRVRFLVIFIVLQFALAELAVNKQERFILPLAPAFALLTGFWAMRLWDRCQLGSARRLFGVGLAAAAVTAFVTLTRLELRRATVDGPSSDHTLLGWLSRDAAEHGPTLVLSSVGFSPAPGAIDWQLVVDGRINTDGAGTLTPNLADRAFVETWPQRVPPWVGTRLADQIRRYPPAVGGYTAYAGMPLDLPDEFAPATYGSRVGALLANRPVTRIVVLVRDPDETAPQLTEALVMAALERLGFAPDTRGRAFRELRVRAIAFRRG